MSYLAIAPINNVNHMLGYLILFVVFVGFTWYVFGSDRDGRY